MSTPQENSMKDSTTSEEVAKPSELVTEEPKTCDKTPIEEIVSEKMDSVLDDPKPENPTDEEQNNDKTDTENIVDKTDTENQVVPDETNENETSDKTSSSKSRELKSILALSKEAKLDTNLPAKRKESTRKRDFAKLHNFGLSGKSPTSRSSQESKNFKFPVTAEAELEEESFGKPIGADMESPRPAKRVRTVSRESGASGSADDAAKKNRRMGSGEVNIFKPNKDMFCWRCHKDNVNIACETCPRSYHWKCLRQTVKNDTEHWPCPECVSILKAESTHTRSEAMKGMTLEHLCSLLKYALNRMIQCQGSEPFLHPVNDEDFPAYKKYIIQPMDLTKIEKNIKNNLYGSTQAFEADAKWILHNCIIFNSYQSKLTYTAKNIVRVCKQEMAEVELCPNCYLNANSKKNTWFVEVCPKPHILVWAKLKGFPYWPAKAMCTNSTTGMVDVRFFGAHDRAWVHYKECYLYSEKDPNTFKQKRYDIEKCIEEVDIYIENLRKVYGEFRYAPYKTFLDPNHELKQLQISLPKYKNPKLYSSLLRKKFKECLSESKAESLGDESERTANQTEGEDEKHGSKEEEKNTTTTDKESTEDGDDTKIKEETETKNELEAKNLDESLSSAGSPFESTNKIDNDTTLEEGYGTDDSTADDIDLERRKAFVDPKHNLSTSEEAMDDEDDGDTQIPNNISVDSLFKGKVRMRGGLGVAKPGKIKIHPRRQSELSDNLKRHSTDSSEDAHLKLPRRNSDLSNKSDSSRISNISDKINRIEAFEKMEVTLGTDDIARVSISEDISCDSTSKSGSEHSAEIKRKPVQVDIDNAEFTISPSSKLKMSETLIKRLSDPNSAELASKVENVNKRFDNDLPRSTSTSPSKSHTDMLIAKFKDVIDSKGVDVKESSASECCSLKEYDVKKDDEGHAEDTETTTSTIKENNTPKKDTISADVMTPEKKESPNQQSAEEIENTEPNTSETTRNSKQLSESSPTELLKKQKLLIQPSITAFTKPLKKRLEKRKPIDDSETDESEEDEEKIKSIEFDKEKIFTIIHSSLNEEEVGMKKTTSRDSDEIEKEKLENENSETDKDENLPLSVYKESDETTKQIDEKTKITNDKNETTRRSSEETDECENKPKIKIKIAEIKPPSSSKTPKHDTIKARVPASPSKKSTEHTDSGIIPVKASINQIGSSNKEFRSYSNMKHKYKVVSSDSNKTRSDGEATEKSKSNCEAIEKLKPEAEVSEKPKPDEAIEKPKPPGKAIVKSKSESETTEKSKLVPPMVLKKRKFSADETSSSPSNKLVKLVPIESILNRGMKQKEVSIAQSKSGILKSPVNSTPDGLTSGERNSTDEMLVHSIKSEPESDDDFQESENLEAKKRYLSALNISEKHNDSNKARENEIRTRARAEEKRERFKIVDNLTRVIDDVALNYSANHDSEQVPPDSVDRRNLLTPSTSNSTVLEGEITVKSFAKIPNNPPPNQQRARKSFPTPSSSKSNLGTPKKPSDVAIRDIKPSPLPPNASKETSLTCTTSSNTSQISTHNHAQVNTTTNFTTQITSTISTTLRTISNCSTPLSSHSSTLTAVINPSVNTATVPPSTMLGKAPDAMGGAGTMSHVILFPTPSANYGSPIVNPVLGMVSSSIQPQIPIISAVAHTTLTPSQQSHQSLQSKVNKIYQLPNVSASQNYIPQNENRFILENSSAVRSSAPTPNNNVILNNLLSQQIGVGSPSVSTVSINTTTGIITEQQQMAAVADTNNSTSSSTSAPGPSREHHLEEDLTLLNSIVPENVTRAVNELMMRPPPRLKPRPPGMLSSVFDDGIPSSAGEITAKINSIAHRMNDYLRGMLIETLEDLGRSANPEAKIISLQLEVEALKYRHNVEMQEIKKNMGILLKDIQRSIEENRERIISEARSAWEAETIKRVELAKSKQWCANCSKEAKFYCCWNTSYCDYPCQQKHWPQHLGKCTQNIEKSTGSGPVVPTHTVAGQPVILRQTTGSSTKPGSAPRIVAKPTKVYMNSKTGASPKTYKALSSTGNHITVIETTLGNYELLGNGPLIGGKLYPAGSSVLNSRFKSANIMSVTPPSSVSNTSRPSGSSETMKSSIASNSKPNFNEDDDE